jgi:hypothetical protein
VALFSAHGAVAAHPDVSSARSGSSPDFLEVLADIAPDAVAQARAAGGLKEQ